MRAKARGEIASPRQLEVQISSSCPFAARKDGGRSGDLTKWISAARMDIDTARRQHLLLSCAQKREFKKYARAQPLVLSGFY